MPKSSTLSFTQINITSATKNAQFVHQSSSQTLASAQGVYQNLKPARVQRKTLVRPTTAKVPPAQNRVGIRLARPPSGHPTLYRHNQAAANYASSNLTHQPSTQVSAKPKPATKTAK